MQIKCKHSFAGISIVVVLGGIPAIGADIEIISDMGVNAVEINGAYGLCSIKEAIINSKI